MQFDDADMLGQLDSATAAALDTLPFGVVGLDRTGRVEIYSEHEAAASGLTRHRVLGRHFFFDIAPCMNNFMVAERFESDAVLDEILPYVLTFRMRPTPARLRLLSAPRITRRYVLVERR